MLRIKSPYFIFISAYLKKKHLLHLLMILQWDVRKWKMLVGKGFIFNFSIAKYPNITYKEITEQKADVLKWFSWNHCNSCTCLIRITLPRLLLSRKFGKQIRYSLSLSCLLRISEWKTWHEVLSELIYPSHYSGGRYLKPPMSSSLLWSQDSYCTCC